MSFARLALRRTAIEAVRAGTYAFVSDSQMAPIEKFALGHTMPVIMVFTDEAKADIKGTELLTSDMLKLVFQVVITQKTKLPVVDSESGDVVGDQDFWQTAQTDAHMELMLDLLCRDIDLALTDPNNPWADLFKDMCVGITSRASVRGMAGPHEDRFAAWQVIYDVQLLKEPARGQIGQGSVWQRFLDLMEAEPGNAPIMGLLKATLDHRPDEPLDVYAELRQAYGLSVSDEAGLLMTEALDAVPEA